MNSLTARQKQAYDLRKSGLKLAEIARIMGTTKDPVRKWIARAEWKIEHGGKPMPEQDYSTMHIRIDHDLHKWLKMECVKTETSLNQWIIDRIAEAREAEREREIRRGTR